MRTKANRTQQWRMIEEAHRKRMETLNRLRVEEIESYKQLKKKYADVRAEEKSGE